MRWPSVRTAASRYSVATAFLVLVAAADVVLAALPAHLAAQVRLWASTNVDNLHHHPVQALVFSAFLAQDSNLLWLAVIALAMFGANRALGNWRFAVVCAAGQVVGTLVSEGIESYRIDHGKLPASAAHIIDIGPSYVVVSAIVVAVMYGSWLAKLAALADFAGLVVIGDIFGGLSNLNVAPVGHVVAMITAAVFGHLLTRRRGAADAAARRARAA
jgi:hypothetical protein